MKLTKRQKFGFITMLLCMVFMAYSCSDDTSDSESMLYGKVTGIITDVSSSPLEGVSVVVDESGLTATMVEQLLLQMHRENSLSKIFQ